MSGFRLFTKGPWIYIGSWDCKYDQGRRLCGCCQPKNIVSPAVLKHPDPEVRDIFRQTDSTGKSKTPKGSRRPGRKIELQTRPGRHNV